MALTFQEKSRSTLLKLPQVILAIHSMNVRTDLTAVIKIYVARIVLAKQPSTVSYVHTAMNTVRTLFARSVQHVLDRLMSVMGAKRLVNAAC